MEGRYCGCMYLLLVFILMLSKPVSRNSEMDSMRELAILLLS